MSGRGDNNKNGTSGQGASKQSTQGLGKKTGEPGKANHGRQTGGTASTPQKGSRDQSSNRDKNTENEQ